MTSNLLSCAIEAAKKAGFFLKESFDKPFQVSRKEGKKNLVTDCDIAAENLITSFIRSKFPNHGFLCEESGLTGTDAEIKWVIDPLDGTVNFAYHIPLFSVSIAACRGDEVLVGVVYQPMTEELFFAEKGQGAFLNHKRICVSKEASLSESFLSIEIPYNFQDHPERSISPLLSFLNHGIPVRRLGSSAINLAYVAGGRFDAFFEVDLFPWDVAAGILLVEEAGGKISQYSGKKRSPLSKGSLLASNGALHESMLQTLRRNDETH